RPSPTRPGDRSLRTPVAAWPSGAFSTRGARRRSRGRRTARPGDERRAVPPQSPVPMESTTGEEGQFASCGPAWLFLLAGQELLVPVKQTTDDSLHGFHLQFETDGNRNVRMTRSFQRDHAFSPI